MLKCRAIPYIMLLIKKLYFGLRWRVMFFLDCRDFAPAAQHALDSFVMSTMILNLALLKEL